MPGEILQGEAAVTNSLLVDSPGYDNAFFYEMSTLRCLSSSKQDSNRRSSIGRQDETESDGEENEDISWQQT